jgi:SHS2 domain-containing protein
MTADSARWVTIEHTADLAVEVRASERADLFVAAARALTGLLLGEESGDGEEGAGAPKLWRDVDLEAPDEASLLVEWLRELLWVHASEGLLFVGAELAKLSETRLAGRVGLAEPSDDSSVQRELKGVTYHDLEVRRVDDGWYARIVFDV